MNGKPILFKQELESESAEPLLEVRYYKGSE
jgi:hypothetical protein